jgi:hypothetical protein
MIAFIFQRLSQIAQVRWKRLFLQSELQRSKLGGEY